MLAASKIVVSNLFCFLRWLLRQSFDRFSAILIVRLPKFVRQSFGQPFSVPAVRSFGQIFISPNCAAIIRLLLCLTSVSPRSQPRSHLKKGAKCCNPSRGASSRETQDKPRAKLVQSTTPPCCSEVEHLGCGGLHALRKMQLYQRATRAAATPRPRGLAGILSAKFARLGLFFESNENRPGAVQTCKRGGVKAPIFSQRPPRRPVISEVPL